jgi:predicted amidohydrolase YtcJ
LQHCQMADAAQFRRMARLGICANLFANHLYYWGDAHYTLTMGPDRANRMDACGTALQAGVPLAIHSDAPITPMGPLFTAWCAVNRVTSSGRILGESERISVPQALYAITMGAAFTLRLDDRIGSIEVGKFADFCVLADDPLTVAPMALKDIAIVATVLGGRVLDRPGA